MNMAYVYANAMKDVIILNANTCRILCFYLIKINQAFSILCVNVLDS